MIVNFQAIDFTLGIGAKLGGRLLAAAYLVHGLLLTLVSEQQCGFYGWGSKKEDIFLMENIGTAILATGVLPCCMLPD